MNKRVRINLRETNKSVNVDVSVEITDDVEDSSERHLSDEARKEVYEVFRQCKDLSWAADHSKAGTSNTPWK